MSCRSCGIDGPTKYVEFYQNIGMLFARRSAEVKGDLCRTCIGTYFKSYTLTTLFLGWWGLISFFLTPCFILNNVVRYLLSFRLPKPDFAAMSTVHVSADAVPPSVGSGSFKFKMIYGVIIGLVVLGVVAFNSVRFMEKHAPAVNAQLHQGEITDESDGEYTGTKIRADIDALNKDTNATTWAELRPDFLSRESYLNDLKTQNNKLQRRLEIEQNANLGANDVCEQLVLDELGPALKDYVEVLSKEFSVIKSTPTPTQDTVSLLGDLGKREAGARQQFNTYIGHRDEKRCK